MTEATTEAAAKATKVLVVEDERIIAKGLEKRLLALGYQIAGSLSSGEDAIAQAAGLKPDVILMDIRLGEGMDGVEAAQRIRQQLDIPVIFLTAFSDDSTLERAKLAEPAGYILKPYEDKDIQTTIEIGIYKHLADKRLRENEQWLASTLGAIGDGVIATDEHGRVRFLNEVAEQLSGWPRAEALGKNLGEILVLVEESTRAPVADVAAKAMRTGRPARLNREAVLVGRSGAEFLIGGSAAPIRNPNGQGTGAVVIFRDMTDRRRFEEQARQAHKMEAIGRLARGITHEFNNILTIITGFSEVLLRDELPRETRLDFTRKIYEAGNKAATITNQIMAFSTRQVHAPEALRLSSALNNVANMLPHVLGPDIKVNLGIEDVGLVKADPAQLGQVILNLAANARDAIGARTKSAPQPDIPQANIKGEVTIATAIEDLNDKTRRKYSDGQPGHFAVISVSDNGSGMTSDVIARAFEPFFTTKEFGTATGLGLATAYGIIKANGGFLDVSSTVDTGSTFRIFLPLVQEPKKPAVEHKKSAPPRTETILVVDDEENIRRLAVMVLTSEGYRILEATDGNHAIEMSNRHKGPIHLLVADLMMPNLNGKEAAEQITATRPETKVLFVSGNTDDLVDIDSSNILAKPFRVDVFRDKVRAILDGER